MSPSEQKSVLVVEDDEVSANTLLKFLTKRGYLVEVETHGDRAVKRILAMQPDAVVLDCNLPGKDGFDVCREVRSGYLGPIIMFTSRDDDIDHVQGMDCGADDYMIKPVTPHVVLAHLVALARRPEAVRTSMASGVFSSVAPPASSGSTTPRCLSVLRNSICSGCSRVGLASCSRATTSTVTCAAWNTTA